MTTKQKFDLPKEEVPVVVLGNGRYAYRVMCPWKGKNDKDLYAFKFCSTKDYEEWTRSQEQTERPDSPTERPDSPTERPESPA